ncbi:GNAT family N-acetyltransferase [Hyunsoonleella pacifica]|uniref:GNAT family N-acetyltransferase n=1 Tax=Hyunsoonleella pacifica TaxID=1080224 RepID=A0A4Q9FJZ6_9FLAO|nr:GNAT family N-acetyltransferase [Hyunsoonleella pacifica]TBN13742.1 GNAT family N-acetyltransferase [Hyunsoonleella pacifica]GGD25247.1 hypothetical protein GCM10011368_29130 [Hyunsoonleella pacifica]
MILKLTESKDELHQILELQNKNYYKSISHEVKTSEGFVTVKHSLKVLEEMNCKSKHVIAVDNGKVVAYALTMLKDYKNLIPILVPMFNTFEHVLYKNSKLSDLNYYVMGQICIAEDYRGKGVFKSLYNKHKETYSDQYNLCVTEVSASNPRSLRAHEKTGFKIIHTFRDTTDEWNILSWDWE